MATREELIALAKQAEAMGDWETASKIADDILAMKKPIEAKGLDVAKQMAVSAVAEPVKGLVGLGTLLTGGNNEEANVNMQRFQSAREQAFPQSQQGQTEAQAIAENPVMSAIGKGMEYISKGAGNVAFDITGSPTVAAIAEGSPEAIMQLAGLGASRKIPTTPIRSGLTNAAERQSGKASELTTQAGQILAPEPTDFGVQAAAQALKQSGEVDASQLIQPNPEYYRAAEELGIKQEPLPSFASQNPQYVALEQGLAAVPASQLDVQSKQFITAVTQRADQLIADSGGSLDKADVSSRFREGILQNVDDIYKAEANVYDAVRKAIPETQGVEASNTLRYINARAKALGGFDKLPAQMKAMHRDLSGKTTYTKGGVDILTGQKIDIPETKLPTFELLNQTKKEIGQQLGRKGDTKFKNMETGQLKAMYAVLKSDLDKIANDSGVGGVVEAANTLTKQRKDLENNMKVILGRDLQKDLMPVLGSAVKGIADGKMETFKRTLENIPAPYRQEAVVSSLNDIFRGKGQGAEAFDATQYTKFMNQLDRSPTTKNLLYKELPVETREAMENLRILAKGISDANKDRIPTGRVMALFDEKTGLVRRMIGKGLVMGASMKGGPIAGMVASDFLSQTSDGAIAASKLIESEKFQSVIKQAAKEGVAEGNMASDKLLAAEKALAKSEAYKKWAETLSDVELGELTTKGAVQFLLAPKPVEEEQGLTIDVQTGFENKQVEPMQDPQSMINQAEQVKRQSIIESANKSVMDKADSIATAYKVPANRNLGIDLGHVASLPPYIGTQLLREANPQTAPINEAIIRLAHGNPENRQAVKMVKNMLQNTGMLLPDSIAGSIQNMVASGIKPEKAVQLATAQKTIKPQEAKKIAELIRGKLSPDVIKDFAPLISSIEALA